MEIPTLFSEKPEIIRAVQAGWGTKIEGTWNENRVASLGYEHENGDIEPYGIIEGNEIRVVGNSDESFLKHAQAIAEAIHEVVIYQRPEAA